MTRRFLSLDALAKVLTQNGKKAVAQAEAGLVEAARLIQVDAQSRVSGEGDTPSDWAALAPATEARKAALGYASGEPLAGSGALRDSIVVEQDGATVTVGSALDVAAYQEFGTATIPPRPFLGPALLANEEKIVELVGGRAVGALLGR